MQYFINNFQMNQLLSFQMFMTPGERLAQWVLPLEQKSYVPYIRKVIKDIYISTDIYTYIHLYIYIHMHIHICTYTYICKYVHIYKHICIYVYIYMYIYMYIYIYIFIYIFNMPFEENSNNILIKIFRLLPLSIYSNIYNLSIVHKIM